MADARRDRVVSYDNRFSVSFATAVSIYVSDNLPKVEISPQCGYDALCFRIAVYDCVIEAQVRT